MNTRIEIVETQDGNLEYIRDLVTGETITEDGMYILEENVNQMHNIILELMKKCQENNVDLEDMKYTATEYYEEVVGEIEKL